MSSCTVSYTALPMKTDLYFQPHGEQHVKKFYSTVAIDNRRHALKPVRGYSFTGEDTNIFYPWLLKNGAFFNISIYISFMRTLI